MKTRTNTTILTAVVAAMLLLLTGTALASGPPYPELTAPPQSNWDGQDIRERMEPPSGDLWIGGFQAGHNLPPIVDFDTTMGQREQLIANEMLTALNNERSARGLRTLTMDNSGVGYATALSHRNSAMDALFHSDESTGDTLHFYFPNWIDQNDQNIGGYPRSTGENVQSGDGVTLTSGDSIRSYMASTGHRTSILGGDYDSVGIGVACQIVYNPSAGGSWLGMVMTTIIPIRTHQLPPSWQDPSYSAYPLGNPPPQGTIVTPANSGHGCFELPPGCNGLGPDDCVGPPTTGGPTTTTTTAPVVTTGPAGPTTPNPDSEYVRAVYELFLGRQPSQVERHAGIALVQASGRSALTGSLSTSSEWAGVVVDGIYQSALGRAADPGGRAYWVSKIDSGSSTREIAIAIYGSTEAYNSGGGTNHGYALYLYDRILRRPADAGGLAYWTSVLDGGTSPGSVVNGFWDSVEFRRNRVQQTYQDVLGRNPDPGGWTYWAGLLLQFDEVRLAAQLAASQEFYTAAQ